MPDPLLALLIGVLLLSGVAFIFWPRIGVLAQLQRRQRRSARVLGEDALKFMYENAQTGHKNSLQGIAGRLQIDGARAAQLLHVMQAEQLVTVRGDAIELTEEGQRYALQVIRAHRLWERYLAETSGFEAAEWHELADHHEHRLTPEAVNALSDQLGHPTHDPHGDPIPTRKGELAPNAGRPLATLQPGASARIVHLEDEPDVVYAELVLDGLHPGQEVQLIDVDEHQVRFLAMGEEHILSPLAAANVSVVPLAAQPAVAPSGDPLSVLKPGEQGRVVALSPALRGPERRRMLDLGILPDTVITAEMISPSGDPTAYRVRGALIALRKEQAEMIKIERQNGQAKAVEQVPRENTAI